MALPPPFVPTPPTPSLVPAGALDRRLKDRVSQSSSKAAFAHMGIALADLTGVGEGPDKDRSFSVNLGVAGQHQQQFAVGSLTKIFAMFAAFRLRERVKAAVAAVSAAAKDADAAVAEVEAAWRPQVVNRIAKSPHDFPNLRHIFTFSQSAPWAPAFRDGAKGWDELNKLHDKGKGVIDKLEFLDRMKLMIRFSDNMASGSCVRDIGFQYLNGSLAAEGFADDRVNGVLWLGGDFGYGNSADIMGPPPWDNGQAASWVRANALGVVSYLTLLWLNRLAKNGNGPSEMREILKDRGVGYATYLGNNTPNKKRSFSKIGLLGSIISEGLIVECLTEGGSLIRYAAVGLNATEESTMKELAGIFYDCVSAEH